MAEAGVNPNLGTLNSTLEALSQVAGWRQSRLLSLQVIAEFSSLGIQPSLASYYYLLIIHCRERKSYFFFEILMFPACQGMDCFDRTHYSTFLFYSADFVPWQNYSTCIIEIWIHIQVVLEFSRLMRVEYTELFYIVWHIKHTLVYLTFDIEFRA